MAETLHLQVATPDRLLVDEEVVEVQAPGANGYLGILPDHAPLLSELSPGEMYYVTPTGVRRYLAISAGWIEVLPDKVRVLAAAAEGADEIDVQRAEQALRRAEERLRILDGSVDVARALNAIRRAQARLATARDAGAAPRK